ncbi:MAG TPA: SRPBCC family protein [Kofleriaceae bacterium]|nr:SRPBCC family protein [Kofleriaceae bacterium]
MTNKLQLVPGAPNEIIFEREFDAPRHLVYQAMTTPELLKRWLGNSLSPLVDAQVDLRIGGTYRQVFRRPDGAEFAFSGVYREIGIERTIFTQRFNDMPNEALITTTLVENAGKTRMRMVQAFDSAQTRDFVIGTGMEKGAAESYDNLDQLVQTL